MKFPTLAKILLSKKYLAMDLDALIEEHKNLVEILESKDPQRIEKELLEQKKELEHYISLEKTKKKD